MDDMKPVPCDRIYELLIDGAVWRTVKKCDIRINKAIDMARQHAWELQCLDGKPHEYGVHLKGEIDACPVTD